MVSHRDEKSATAPVGLFRRGMMIHKAPFKSKLDDEFLMKLKNLDRHFEIKLQSIQSNAQFAFSASAILVWRFKLLLT